MSRTDLFMNNIDSNLRISIKDFRAINEADISLNGITVLAGENGSGKSTVSELVYYFLKEMNNYNDIVLLTLSFSLKKYLSVFDSIILTTASNFDEYESFSKLTQLKNLDDLQLIGNNISALCNIILERYNNNRIIGKDRFRRILINTMNLEDEVPFQEALKKVEEVIQNKIKEAQEQVRKRPSSLFKEFLNQHFGERVSKKVSLYEYGEILFTEDQKSVPVPHFVNNLFYIDTPFALMINEHHQHWKDLNDALKEDIHHQTDSHIAYLIENSVIKGEAFYEKADNHSGFVFQDKRGNKFSLSLAATGIRSFAIILMLLKKGQISDNTLLILDEPESHLHPQWVIEYARMIVLIHKYLGTKFLISSHSPEMVSAIRYIAEAEGCTASLEFYIAKKAKYGKGRYNFKSTGLNIDPTFRSFNKSFDILNSYTSTNEQEG